MRPIISQTCLIIIAAFSLLSLGCDSELATVSGTVTLDGQPLTQGTVTFQSPGKPMATGDIQPNGTYSAQTGSRTGVLPGEYAVTVSAYKNLERGNQLEQIPELFTPQKYNSPSTSQLSAKIESGSNRVDLPLSSK